MDLTGRTQSQSERLLNRAIQANLGGYMATKSALLAGKAFVWGNVDGNGQGPSPEDAVAMLGTDAATWFMASAAASRSLAIADLSANGVNVPTEEQIASASLPIMPSGWTYTVNPDGTVTLNRPQA